MAKTRKYFDKFINKKFGKLRLLEVNALKGRYHYLCKCDCGTYTAVSAYNLLSNKYSKTRSCGCRKYADYHNIINTYVNSWFIVKEFKHNGRSFVEAICKCGKKSYIRTSSLFQKANSKSCGRCRPDKMKTKLGYLYRVYKVAAKNRNLPFYISFKYFKEMIFKPCYYCGTTEGNIAYMTSKLKGVTKVEKKFAYNGIDRLDNNKGYSIKNCVPCCAKCNRMKMIYSKEEFIAQINKIYEYQRRY